MTERLPTRFPPSSHHQKTPARCNALSCCHVRARCSSYLVRPLKNASGKLKHIKPVPAHLHPGKLRKFNRSLYRSGRLRLKCGSTRAETRFSISAKRTSPFKSAGASVQSTTGSRDVRISGSNAGYTMFRGSVKGTGYPLHSPVSPSLPLSRVTVCHHISTGVYCIMRGEKRGCWL